MRVNLFFVFIFYFLNYELKISQIDLRRNISLSFLIPRGEICNSFLHRAFQNLHLKLSRLMLLTS